MMNKTEIAKLIDSFLDGSCGEWDWDDFISVRLKDRELEDIRQRCAEVEDKFPPTRQYEWCSDEGERVLRGIADELRHVRS